MQGSDCHKSGEWLPLEGGGGYGWNGKHRGGFWGAWQSSLALGGGFNDVLPYKNSLSSSLFCGVSASVSSHNKTGEKIIKGKLAILWR